VVFSGIHVFSLLFCSGEDQKMVEENAVYHPLWTNGLGMLSTYETGKG
jgi:hypothetical protein